MRFITETAALASALRICSEVHSEKDPNPLLHNVRIDAGAKALVLTAASSLWALSISLPVNPDAARGTEGVNLSKLLGIVNLAAGESTIVANKGPALVVSSAETRWTLNRAKGMGEFPGEVEVPPDATWTLDLSCREFTDAVRTVAYASADVVKSPQFGVVHFDGKRAAAADFFRCQVTEAGGIPEMALATPVALSLATIAFLSLSPRFRVAETSTAFFFVFADLVARVPKLVASADIGALFFGALGSEAEGVSVPADALHLAVRQAQAVGGELVTLSDGLMGALVVSTSGAWSPEEGSSVARVPVKGGPPPTTRLWSRHLLDALKLASPSESVVIRSSPPLVEVVTEAGSALLYEIADDS